jgi:hypothetical protein
VILYKVCPLCRGESRSPWAYAVRDEDDRTGVLAVCSCSGRGFVPAAERDAREAFPEIARDAYAAGRQDTLLSRSPVPEA